MQSAVRKGLPVTALAEIEVTTECRARCAFCPRRALTRPKGRMSLRTAEKIGRNLARGQEPLAVLISGFGEPTLHPELPELVEVLAGSLPKPVGVVTNGENLSPELAEKLIKAGISFFHVSVHAATSETARIVTPGLAFDRVERNLENLLALAGERIPVAVNFVLTKRNRAEKRVFAAKWRAAGLKTVYVSPAHNRGGHLEIPGTERVRRQCWIYLYTLFVAWDGRVLTCCHDLAAEEDFGNLAVDDPVQIKRRKTERMSKALERKMCRRCDFSLADPPNED